MVLDTTACQRVKVKATSVCQGPDRGQKVSVRVRTPGDPESALTVACRIHVSTYFGFSACRKSSDWDTRWTRLKILLREIAALAQGTTWELFNRLTREMYARYITWLVWKTAISVSVGALNITECNVYCHPTVLFIPSLLFYICVWLTLIAWLGSQSLCRRPPLKTAQAWETEKFLQSFKFLHFHLPAF